MRFHILNQLKLKLLSNKARAIANFAIALALLLINLVIPRHHFGSLLSSSISISKFVSVPSSGLTSFAVRIINDYIVITHRQHMRQVIQPIILQLH